MSSAQLREQKRTIKYLRIRCAELATSALVDKDFDSLPELRGSVEELTTLIETCEVSSAPEECENEPDIGFSGNPRYVEMMEDYRKHVARIKEMLVLKRKITECGIALQSWDFDDCPVFVEDMADMTEAYLRLWKEEEEARDGLLSANARAQGNVGRQYHGGWSGKGRNQIAKQVEDGK